MADPLARAYTDEAVKHLHKAGSAIAARQTGRGPARGNVPPWRGSQDRDFHGTLAATWIWARYQHLTGDPRFAPQRDLAWSFVERVWNQFVPEALGPAASDEAAYDCALVLRAALAERGLAAGDSHRHALVGAAARLLAAYLGTLGDVSGREFRDPAFLAWNLVDHARVTEDRGLLAAGQRFVERFYGLRTPPAFRDEPEDTRGLFDFSSTTATRVLAVMASEGSTPFVGAWLRERVLPVVPTDFVERAFDANAWNACVATAMGKAYTVSTDPGFRDACVAILATLAGRDADQDGAVGRGERGDAETLPTFYWALAVDSLVREGPASSPTVARNGQGRRG